MKLRSNGNEISKEFAQRVLKGRVVLKRPTKSEKKVQSPELDGWWM